MDKRRYRILMRIALLLTLAWIAWSLYDGFFAHHSPQDRDLEAARRFLEDDRFQEALAEYDRVLDKQPGNLSALRGRAQARMQLGQLPAALQDYDEAIRGEESRGVSDRNRTRLGVSYANRGILKDRMGSYSGALADYRRALELEPATAEGPGPITRFLRNQPERPPNIADRARYLREQLALPESRRLLRIPEKDAAQRPYRM